MKLVRVSRSLVLSIVSACLVSVAAFAAEPTVPQLRGVLMTGGDPVFSLSDGAGGSGWVAIGKTFDDWKLKSYDAGEGALTLERDGREVKVTLESAQIAAAGPEKATVEQADALLQKMQFDDLIEKTIRQQQEAMMKSMRQMMGQNQDAAATERVVEFQKRVIDVMIEEMDIPGMRTDMAQAYADTFTADELRGLTDFYATPAGTAMLEKQPDLQTKMTQIMMPRMMKAMPKIQRMGREFAEEAKTPAE